MLNPTVLALEGSTKTDLMNYFRKELVAFAKSLDINSTGNKQQLVDRIHKEIKN